MKSSRHHTPNMYGRMQHKDLHSLVPLKETGFRGSDIAPYVLRHPGALSEYSVMLQCVQIATCMCHSIGEYQLNQHDMSSVNGSTKPMKQLKEIRPFFLRSMLNRRVPEFAWGCKEKPFSVKNTPKVKSCPRNYVVAKAIANWPGQNSQSARKLSQQYECHPLLCSFCCFTALFPKGTILL